jgi:hypothetical protein
MVAQAVDNVIVTSPPVASTGQTSNSVVKVESAVIGSGLMSMSQTA